MLIILIFIHNKFVKLLMTKNDGSQFGMKDILQTKKKGVLFCFVFFSVIFYCIQNLHR